MCRVLQVVDMAVGALYSDDGGDGRGALYILFLNSDGTVKGEQKISSTQGGLTSPLDDRDNFGSDLGSLGDVDGDGVGADVHSSPSHVSTRPSHRRPGQH